MKVFSLDVPPFHRNKCKGKKLIFQQKNSCNSENKFLILLQGKSCRLNSMQWSQLCRKLLLIITKQWQGGKAEPLCVTTQSLGSGETEIDNMDKNSSDFNFFLLLSCAELLVLKNVQCNWAKWGERIAYGALTRASDSAVHFPFPQLQLWQHPALYYLH